MRHRIRALDASSTREVSLVAKRMRETLVEVLGVARGSELYTDSYLVQRVLQHLDPEEFTGQVYLAEVDEETIAGHTMLRLDDDGHGSIVGLFSTVFVAPEFRRQGIAAALIRQGEQWMLENEMTRAVTYTDKGNAKLQALFAEHGYALEPMPNDFVALSKALTRAPRKPEP